MRRHTTKEAANPEAVLTAGTAPVGGHGASSKCSRVFVIPPACSSGIRLDGTRPGNPASWLNEQVIQIQLRPKRATKTYGHDKSCGAQDETPGLDSFDGSIKTRVQCVTAALSLGSGDLAWIQVYPLGSTASDPIEGYARITDELIDINLENGDPVEHTYNFVSKGQWIFPNGISGNWTGCCVECKCSGGVQAEEPANLEPALLDSDPVTVYKWNGSGWAVAFSELPAGYVMGPAPDAATDKPKRELDTMRFVQGVKVAPTADLHSHPLATEGV